ncbi:MAG: Asp-tRNA(Asn)/Glu-tRNA(Gln) amidotransferase subunit GatB [Phycisphaerales bacterium]|nr:Asp-tRNA(Asn)/Glu-tRNA(Gln) amidotransferase subunit GatB [Phycisphaerales bacterium]
MSYSAADIDRIKLIVGMEVHVELATRTKMFSRAPSPACPEFDPHDNPSVTPNTLIDATVLALPGALPVMNKAAVDMAIKVGLALNCQIAPITKWDRKSYFYPDLPKAYQISQYDLPICFDGSIDVPAVDDKGQVDLEGEPTRIGILRAHLEEDAGKLLHEAPGGGTIDGSIADYNRAGTPLLEIVTQPEFTSSAQVVSFCKQLRNICRFLGVTEGIMQRGHMRFEPNINLQLTMKDGKFIKTPIVEVKNLNSFKSVENAIEYEFNEQPRRWLADRREMGRGTKQTRGWDDRAEGGKGATVLQREKEDAHDYRYFPDPDLVPVVVNDEWKERIRATIPELPLARFARFMNEFGLGKKEAAALIDERDVCLFYERTFESMESLGIDHTRAGKLAANILLQSGAKRANEQHVEIHQLGISPEQVASIGKLREDGKLNNQNADELFGLLCKEIHHGEHREHGESQKTGLEKPLSPLSFSVLSVPSVVNAPSVFSSVESLAQSRNMLTVRDDAAMAKWVDQAIAENTQAAADVKAGKLAAVGRLVGAAMKHSGGSGDAKTLREAILARLGAG